MKGNGKANGTAHELLLDIPQALDAERSILGSILLNEKLYQAGEVSMEEFSLDSHRQIYAVMVFLVEEGRPIDMITVSNELDHRGQIGGVGGRVYISGLTDGMPYRTHIDEYVLMVKRAFIYRKILHMAERVRLQALEQAEAPEEIISEFYRQGLAAVQSNSDKGVDLIHECSAELMDWIVRVRSDKEQAAVGMTYALKCLDEATTGMREGETTVIGARAGCGKSSFALTTAIANARQGTPVYFRSDEMRKDSLLGRTLSNLSMVNNFHLRDPRRLEEMDMFFLKGAMDEAKRLPLYVDDVPGLHIDTILNRARKVIESKGVKLCVFDYLQIIRGDGKDVKDRVGGISETISKFARETRTHCMVLSQLSRPEKKAGKTPEPTLTELRESGRIEDNADVVILLHRGEEDSLAIIAKQRNGPMGRERIVFSEKTLVFRDV